MYKYSKISSGRRTVLRWRKGKVHPRTGYDGPVGKQMYSSTLSLTSALNEGRWSTPRPGLFTRGKENRYLFYSRLCGLQAQSERVREISPPPRPGFDPRTVQPVANRYTDWAIPAHTPLEYLSSIFLHFSVTLSRLCAGQGRLELSAVAVQRLSHIAVPTAAAAPLTDAVRQAGITELWCDFSSKLLNRNHTHGPCCWPRDPASLRGELPTFRNIAMRFPSRRVISWPPPKRRALVAWNSFTFYLTTIIGHFRRNSDGRRSGLH